MSDIEDRLTDIERRLQQLELTGVRPFDPLQPVQWPQRSTGITKHLVFWLLLVVLGVVIWEFANGLAP